MSQSTIFFAICFVAILLWAINTLIPRSSIIRTILNVVVMIAAVVSIFVAF